MKKKTFACIILTACIISWSGFVNKSEAGFTDVLNVINQTGRTINTINSAGRSTMNTIEYGQRFQDRQQDRQDRKRAEKAYNESAEQEYYRTLQETQQLKRYNNEYNDNL